MNHRNSLISVLFCLLLIPASTSAQAPIAGDPLESFRPLKQDAGTLIVQFKDGIANEASLPMSSIREVRPLVRIIPQGVTPGERFPRYHVLEIAKTGLSEVQQRERLLQLSAALEKREDVISVSYDYGVAAATERFVHLDDDGGGGGGGPIPNDPLYNGSGILEHPVTQSLGNQWPLEIIDAPDAWPTEHGNDELPVTIAVLDTGVDFAVTDLFENMWINELEQGNDEDQNGYVGDVMGWDFIADQPVSLSSDIFGHGTHVAGVAAARGHNAIGMVGVIWNAKIMNVKVLGNNGFGTLAQVAAGIVYAADNGADIINMSLSTSGWLPAYSVPYLTDAIDYATAEGALLVAAAGNGGIWDIGDHEAGVMPSSTVNTMAVSNFDEFDQLGFFSNTGRGISVAAPGGTSFVEGIPDWWHGVVSLRSTVMNNPLYEDLLVEDDYLRLGGTSQAAPHVAGLGALIKSSQPSFRSAVSRFVIEDSAVDVGAPGNDIESGYGRIDVHDGLSLAGLVLDPTRSELLVNQIGVPLEAEVSTSFSVRTSVQNIGDGDATGAVVRVYADDELVGSTTVDLATGATAEVGTSVSLSVPGPYTLRASVNDDFSIPEYRTANNSLAKTMAIATEVLDSRVIIDTDRFRDHMHACDLHLLWSERSIQSEDFEIFAFTWNPGDDISVPGVGTGPIGISSNGENNVFPVCDANTIAWIKKSESGDSIVTRQISGGPHVEVPLGAVTAWDLDLSAGNLVWREQTGNVADIRWATVGADGVYSVFDDGLPVTVVANVNFNVTAPKVDGLTLVWDYYDTSLQRYVVRRAQLTSPQFFETLTLTIPLNSHKPNVYGDNVVWMTNENNPSPYNTFFIYLKQGSAPPMLLDSGAFADEGESYVVYAPQIERDRVSWVRYLNKNSFPWGSRIMMQDFGPDGVYGTFDDPDLSQKTDLNDFDIPLGMTGNYIAATLFSIDYETSDVLVLSSDLP